MAVLHLHWWHWTTTQWATVLSAVFAALATGAAWRAVAISLALQRAARVPHVSGAVLHNLDTHQLRLTFANAGPVLAVQVVYFLVANDEKRGALVGDGHLAVGEKVTFDTTIMSLNPKDPAHLVWGWRDLDDNVYFRNSDWQPKRISRRRYVRRKDTTLGAMFREMYPDVPIP